MTKSTSVGKLTLLLVALLWLLAACAPAPVYTISGKISGSWRCIDLASTIHPPTITLNPLDWTHTFTRSEPEFSFDNVKAGDYTLVVTCTANGSTYPAMPVTVSGADLTVDVILPFPQLVRTSPLNMGAGHNGRVRGLAFSPDGSELVSASEDGSLIRWNAASGERIKTWRHEHTNPLLPLALSPDGDILAAGEEDGTIRLWEKFLGDLLHTLPGDGISYTNLTFSAGGDTLAAWVDGDTGKVTLWDVATGEPLGSIKVVEGEELRQWPGESILILPGDADLVSSIANDKELTISWWQGTTVSRTESTTLSAPQAQMLSGMMSGDISADGTRAALGIIGIENRGGLLIWNMSTGRSVVGRYEFPLTHAGFSPDGALVASTAHDNTVVLWDANTGEAYAILASDHEGINQFAWSPTGHMLAAADEKGAILLWEIP